jgi:hypothetical protein
MFNKKTMTALLAGLSLAIVVKADGTTPQPITAVTAAPTAPVVVAAPTTQPAVDLVKRIEAVENTMKATAPKATGVFSKHNVNFYGKFNVKASYQQANGAGADYIEPRKTGSAAADTRNTFNMDPKSTRFGFDVALPEVFGNPVKGKIEADFTGNDAKYNSKNLFNLRHAYVDWRNQTQWGVLMGQTWYPMMVEAPETIYAGGLESSGSIVDSRAMQITVSKGFDGVILAKDKVRTKLGLVKKDTETNTTGVVASTEKTIMPHIQWNICYKHALFGKKRTRVSFSGTAGKNTYTGGDLNGQHYSSWATVGALRMPILTWLSVTGSLGYGANLKGWNDGGISQGVNAIAKKAIHSLFGWAQVSIRPPQYDKIMLNGGVGFDSINSGDLTALKAEADRKRNITYFANISYEITKSTNVGLEYMHKRTRFVQSARGSGYSHALYGTFNYLF